MISDQLSAALERLDLEAEHDCPANDAHRYVDALARKLERFGCVVEVRAYVTSSPDAEGRAGVRVFDRS